MGFAYQIISRPGATQVELHGDMTWEEVTPVQRELWSVADREGQALVIDLSNLDFVDEEGMATLLGLIQRAVARRIRLRLTGEHGQVADRLRRAGIYALLSRVAAAV